MLYNNEKNVLLEKQEDLLVAEKQKNIKLEKSLTFEKGRYKILTKGLNVCNDDITSLKSEKIDLTNEIKCLNDSHASISSVEHVRICTRCKDVDIDACVDSIGMIKRLKYQVIKLEEQSQKGKK
jgi:glucan phosphorylase